MQMKKDLIFLALLSEQSYINKNGLHERRTEVLKTQSPELHDISFILHKGC